MRKAVFHIGNGKTGSTSLQSFLSFNASLDGAEDAYEYCAIRPNGAVESGDWILQEAERSVLNNAVSSPDIATLEDTSLLQSGLEEIWNRGKVPIFSQEDWFRRGAEFERAQLFARLGLTARIVVYVRPQVEWFNSAWWQWWAWDERFTTPEDVLEEWGTSFLCWDKFIKVWRRLHNVSELSVRIHTGDVVRDFCDTLTAKPPKKQKARRENVSMSEDLIKLYNSFPKMRQPHSSYIDAILTDKLGLGGGAPWVLTPDVTQKIISACAADNEKLYERLDETSAAAMKSDNRWWSADAYASMRTVPVDSIVLSAEDSQKLLRDAVQQMINEDLGKRPEPILRDRNTFVAPQPRSNVSTEMNIDQSLIPPEELIEEVRIGRGEFAEVGEAIASIPFTRGWMSQDGSFLDIGCGLGRIARPLTETLSDKGRYWGFDVNRKSIEWCQERYARFENFHFEWIDLHSVFYNPDGDQSAGSFRFPLEDASVDYANLTSVFTHMLPEDANNYLQEVSRMLRPGARCFISYFMVDPDSRQTFKERAAMGNWHPVENGYIRNPDAPEEITLIDEGFVRDMYAAANLTIESLQYGNWLERPVPAKGYQDTVVALKE